MSPHNYPPKKPLVSVAIGTRNRTGPLSCCIQTVLAQDYSNLEVLVLDDASDQCDVKGTIEAFGSSKIQYFRSDQQLGVAGGRNFLAHCARGDIIIVIDDDACFADEQCVPRAVDAFASDPRIGILAVKVIDHRGDKEELLVPFSHRWRKKLPQLSEQPQSAAYFMGTCHAIRKEAFERCGGYQSDFFFYGEELDLSFKAVSAGLSIYYEPQIVVHHHGQPSVIGKRREKLELFYRTRNILFLTHKHMPIRYVHSFLLTRLVFYLLVSAKRGAIPEFLQGISAGLTGRRRLIRRPLDSRAMDYLKRNRWRVWY